MKVQWMRADTQEEVKVLPVGTRVAYDGKRLMVFMPDGNGDYTPLAVIWRDRTSGGGVIDPYVELAAWNNGLTFVIGGFAALSGCDLKEVDDEQYEKVYEFVECPA